MGIRKKKNKDSKLKTLKSGLDTDLLLDNSPIVGDEYKDEANILNSKILDHNVKNIAVVASYGAGKSSAINTYLDKYRNTKKLHKTYTRVSLGSFNDTKYNNDDIERSILQQLLYSQSKNKLPNSKIERTNKTSWWKAPIISLLITLLIGCSILFTLQVSNVFLTQENLTFLSWIFLSLITISFFCLFAYLIHYSKLKRVSYKDIEAEFVKDKNGDVLTTSGQSLINKFVDEVLYFFECINIDLVIFEDLDRLGDQSSKIFVKLRELNTIINNSNTYSDKVTFLYAVKDDMFEKQEERAKFFEFILPIVPVLNPITTSEEIRKIQQKIINKQPVFKLDDEFINNISNYIPNMRVLKNTFNDYMLMRSRIFDNSSTGPKKLKNENLFALCLYKNIYPYDYSALESNSGLIPIIVNRDYLIKDSISSAEKEIKKLTSLLTNADQELIQNFNELKLIFKGQACSFNYQSYSYSSAIGIDNIQTFKDLDVSKIKHPLHSYPIAMQGNQLKMPNGDDYFEREKIIKAKTTQKKAEIAKQIEDYRKEILDYSTFTFNELIKNLSVNSCFNRTGVESIEHHYKTFLIEKGNNIEKQLDEPTNYEYRNHLNYIRFLIKNNYIDENYIEYTSSYKSNLISPKDVNFIKSVQRGVQDFNKDIDNVNSVIERLNASDFSDVSVLNNFILLNLNVVKKYSAKFENLKNILISNNDDVIEKIIEFLQLNNNEKGATFLKEIIGNNNSLCSQLIKSNALSEEKKNYVITCYLKNSENFNKEDDHSIIVVFINESEKYLDILKPVTTVKLQNFISNIDLSIKNIDTDINNDTTQLIIKNYAYELNLNNLSCILEINDSRSDFYMKNYDYISNLNSDLKLFIDKNINSYIKNIFINDAIINSLESIDVISNFLKSDEIYIELKISIISKYTFIITDINEYDTELYPRLIQNNRIEPSWANILSAYANEVEYTNLIKDFVFYNINNITGDFIFEEQTDIINNLFKDIINFEYSVEDSNKLENLANKINASFPLIIDYKNDDNLNIFIKSGLINYNVSDLQFLIDKPKSLCSYVIKFENDINQQFSNFFSSNISFQTINILIFDRNISNNIKQKILTQYGDKIQVNGFEKDLFNVLFSNKLTIPDILLYKFTNNTVLSNIEKCDLATLANIILPDNKHLLVEYMQEAIPALKDISSETKEIKINIESDNMEKLLKKFGELKQYNFTRRSSRATLKKVAS